MGLKLNGKKVLVTGASSGIGWATARALGKKGAVLAISGRRAEALEKLTRQIVADGGVQPIVLVADLSEPGEAAKLGQRATAALGGVDVLVNNAGVGMAASQWVGGDRPEARALFETNYWSALALIRELVPAMRERRTGSVVNVSSVGAILPFVLTGHYGSSKAALVIASDALRMELRGSGVDVLSVLPGPVETAMLAEAKAIEGIDHALTFTKPGNTETLAALIVRAIERGDREIVYPRPLWAVRYFPTFGRWAAALIMRKMNGSDPRLVTGGSHGGKEALTAREAFASANT